MQPSPFPYQGPLEPTQVHGRDDLVGDLIERVTERRVTALIGPRRFGKTSVLRRVESELGDGGAAVVWVDLYEVASIADVAARLDDALAGGSGRFGEDAASLAAAASLNLGLMRVELRSPARSRPDPLMLLHSLLDVLVAAATRSPSVVVFDEFSSITRAGQATGLLRTKLQHHYQQIGLVFSGSEPSMMRTLFADQAEPFYAQADVVEIQPLAIPDVEEIVHRGFARSGKGAGPLGLRVAMFAQGHPQRSMQLADAAWRRCEPGDEATDDTWRVALDDVRQATADGNERLYSNLSTSERDVLRIFSNGGSIFGSAASVLDLSTGAAQHARGALVDRGHVRHGDTGYEVVDPILADWIKRRLPL